MNLSPGQTDYVVFETYNATTGALQNADSTPTLTLYKNGAAWAPTITVTNLTTGIYLASYITSSTTGDEVQRFASATVNGYASTIDKGFYTVGLLAGGVGNGSVTINVKSTASGTPNIQGATVSLNNASGTQLAVATTDVNGNVTLAAAAPVTYYITVTAANYTSIASQSYALAAGGPASLALSLTPTAGQATPVTIPNGTAISIVSGDAYITGSGNGPLTVTIDNFLGTDTGGATGTFSCTPIGPWASNAPGNDAPPQTFPATISLAGTTLTCTIPLTDSDTASLTNTTPGSGPGPGYEYRIYYTDTGGSVTTVAYGQLTVQRKA